MSKGFTALISVMAIVFIGLSCLFGFKSCVNGAVAREKWPNKSAISSQGYVIKVYEHFTDSQPSKIETKSLDSIY